MENSSSDKGCLILAGMVLAYPIVTAIVSFITNLFNLVIEAVGYLLIAAGVYIGIMMVKALFNWWSLQNDKFHHTIVENKAVADNRLEEIKDKKLLKAPPKDTSNIISDAIDIASSIPSPLKQKKDKTLLLSDDFDDTSD